MSRIYNFSAGRFLSGERTTIYRNAPPGFLYPGDPGFVNGQAGMNDKWWQFSPRVGFAWDPTGEGRMSIRSGYSLGYDFVNAQFHLNTSVAPPWRSAFVTASGLGTAHGCALLGGGARVLSDPRRARQAPRLGLCVDHPGVLAAAVLR